MIPVSDTKIKIIDAIDRSREDMHLRGLSRSIGTSYSNTVRNVKILKEENAVYRSRYANLIRIGLNEGPLTLAYLKHAHTRRYLALPKKISDAITEFLAELEDRPLIALIFGSYARDDYRKDSDIDILLVFQEINNPRMIESTSKRIGMRTNTKINPIYIKYNDFKDSFSDKTKIFSKEIRQDIIIIAGLEHYYELDWKTRK